MKRLMHIGGVPVSRFTDPRRYLGPGHFTAYAYIDIPWWNRRLWDALIARGAWPRVSITGSHSDRRTLILDPHSLRKARASSRSAA